MLLGWLGTIGRCAGLTRDDSVDGLGPGSVGNLHCRSIDGDAGRRRCTLATHKGLVRHGRIQEVHLESLKAQNWVVLNASSIFRMRGNAEAKDKRIVREEEFCQLVQTYR